MVDRAGVFHDGTNACNLNSKCARKLYKSLDLATTIEGCHIEYRIVTKKAGYKLE
jgi:hypothetical protein